jgi:regulator of sigma E protease
MILSALFSIGVFILVLFVLVIAHEWGHFYMARKFGVRVYEFGFGFPPKIAKIFHKNGTDYTANWIPLGGFVRLKGEDGSDSSDNDSFAHKKTWQRLVILLAGVVMNFALGYVIFLGLFMTGVDMPAGFQDPDAIVSNKRLVVGGIMKGSPAERAGIKVGDEISKVESDEFPSSDRVKNIVSNSGGKTVALEVVRQKEKKSLAVIPGEIQPGVTGIGVNMVDVASVRYPFTSAIVKAGTETKDVSLLIFKTLGTIVSKLVQSGELQEGVSGPVGIAVVTGKVAASGFGPLLQLMAMLSINLGVLNVLPIPSLDGGRALFVIFEKVIGKKMRGEIEQYAHLIGFALLMLLVVAVTYRDIALLLK